MKAKIKKGVEPYGGKWMDVSSTDTETWTVILLRPNQTYFKDLMTYQWDEIEEFKMTAKEMFSLSSCERVSHGKD